MFFVKLAIYSHKMERNKAESIFKSLENFVFSDFFIQKYKTVHLAIIKSDHSLDQNEEFKINNDYKLEIAFEDFSVIHIGLKSIQKSILKEIKSNLSSKLSRDELPDITFNKRPKLQNQSVEYNPYQSKQKFPNGGTSIINNNLGKDYSGSFGLAFKLKNHSGVFFISNFHVLSRRQNNIIRYETILHPSQSDTYDLGETNLNAIGTLFWFNLNEFMDSAIGKANCEKSVGPGIRCIPDLCVDKIKDSKIGQKVMKCGRSSNLTKGIVRSDYCTVLVNDSNYLISDNGKKLFKDQILTNCMSLGGDSGSVLINNNRNAVGLLFAGDAKTSSYFNKLSRIFKETNVISQAQIMPEIIFDRFI